MIEIKNQFILNTFNKFDLLIIEKKVKRSKLEEVN